MYIKREQMKNIKLIILLLVFATVAQSQPIPPKPFELADYNFVVGTQMIGSKYKFTKDTYLVEQAKQIRGMGSNILKISLGKGYPKVYPDIKPKSGVETTLDVIKTQKDFRKIMDMDFKYIFMWVHTLTDVKWGKPMSIEDKMIIYREMYELSEYLLETYSGSGKTFLIGNWEGDWLLHGTGNRDKDPGDEKIQAMTEWFKIRQAAIDDAKRKVNHKGVELYHYVEVNLVKKGMAGQRCISESILAEANPDLVSYSSYEAIKNHADYESLKSTLAGIMDYMESKLSPKEGIPFERRVFIGEYGYQVSKFNSEAQQNQQTKEVMLASLELNLPFTLHWELYNNEYTDKGVSKGMSLISEEGEFKEVYYLHKNFYIQMNDYLLAYKKDHGVYPSNTQFREVAIKTLKAL
jgi:hypothetical protein